MLIIQYKMSLLKISLNYNSLLFKNIDYTKPQIINYLVKHSWVYAKKLENVLDTIFIYIYKAFLKVTQVLFYLLNFISLKLVLIITF